MCGIAGAIGALGPNDFRRCRQMSERLRHRGPDDSGSWSWQFGRPFGAILEHRRLSIIDLRAVAAQPMIDPDGGAALVFNGEIYNFRDLRRELEAAGARFETNGDSEVILKGYRYWGLGVFARLRGMFAIVMVDPMAGRAVLARDGYGIKPLYWTRFAGEQGRPALAFASEGRALVEAGFAARRTDPGRLGQYLWNGYMPGPQTIWSNVEEVPKGCYAVLDENHPSPRFERFWSIGGPLAPARALDLEQADAAIAESAKVHLTADVPKVVFLSGGVDSTAVAAAATAHDGELHTMSIAFAEADADERRFAAAAAAAIGSRHHVVELSAASIQHDIEAAVDALDQPSFDGINTWFVSREAARQGFKVALSGAGGDELAGGYTTFRRALGVERLMGVPGSRVVARLAGHTFAQLRPCSKVGQLGHAFGALERMYQTQYALFSRTTLRRLVAEPAALAPWGLDQGRQADLAALISPLPILRAVTALESELFLGDRLLRDMDSVSMAHSLELRVPLVDTVLADSLAGLNDADRYLPVGQKQLLRRQSRPMLPDSFFARPKRGFEFPMDAWMRSTLRTMIEERLLDRDQCSALGLSGTSVAALWRQFLARPGAIYWTRPWAIFALLQWAATNQVQCG
jgi:asparagine synthase (glutamine-hydrolysing)